MRWVVNKPAAEWRRARGRLTVSSASQLLYCIIARSIWDDIAGWITSMDLTHSCARDGQQDLQNMKKKIGTKFWPFVKPLNEYLFRQLAVNHVIRPALIWKFMIVYEKRNAMILCLIWRSCHYIKWNVTRKTEMLQLVRKSASSG